ncbi:MAG: hypothetical protein SGCHY_003371 [Lobulomycetales sp.]
MLVSSEQRPPTSHAARKSKFGPQGGREDRSNGLEFNAFDMPEKVSKLKEQSGKSILFNVSKRESFHPSNGFKSLQKRVRNLGKVGLFKEDITFAKLSEASLVIFGSPRETFSSTEFTSLKQYLEHGGSILFLSGEGGDQQAKTNFNYFLEDYGISVNSDCVARTEFFKYTHPKEAFISNGILNREISRAAGKRVESKYDNKESSALPPENGSFDPLNLAFVYPYGATLNVQKPAVPIMSSGPTTYPFNRPIGACYFHPSGKGKLVVVGSVQMFSDYYIEKEENGKLFDAIVQMLTDEKFALNSIDASEPEISDYHQVPDTASLARTVRSCLQESEDLPKDFTTMFDQDLFSFDTSYMAQAIRLYEQLRLKHEPLSLIQPQFETPLPALNPAVFQPAMMDLPPPALDLFDLDEEFASQKARLAQLTNKCNNDDLEYYIRECGDILGISEKLDPRKRDAKHVLAHVMNAVGNWKNSAQ